MECRVIKFEPDHLNGFILRGHTQSPLEALKGLKERLGEFMRPNSHAYTLVVGFEIIGCAGVIESWPGGGEAWAMLSSSVEKYPLFFHRAIKRGLDRIRATYRLHRIQLTVRVDLPHNYHRWVEILGFRFEGLQKMSDPDRNDHYRYALVSGH